MIGIRALILLLTSLLSLSAHWASAFENDGERGYQNMPETPPVQLKQRINPNQRIERFNRALEAQNIPLEPRPAVLDQLLTSGEVSRYHFNNTLKYVDGFHVLDDYLKIKSSSVSLYRDFYSPSISNYYLETRAYFNNTNLSSDSPQLMSAIDSAVRQYGSSQPLAGIRIALDPGHMGGDQWDEITGKYVRPANQSMKVSEGDLNLFTAYLLASEFEALGAEVMLTHEDQAPASTYTLDNYDKTQYRLQYIYNALDSFMAPFFYLSDKKFLSKFRSTLKALDEDPKFNQDQFYIRGEDLGARIEAIKKFKPHLSFDIHYDAHKIEEIQNNVNEVKAYVPGGLLDKGSDGTKRETGSRETKALALKHLLEPNRWNESVRLAQAVVSAMENSTGVPVRKLDAGNAIKVSDGVFARNLYMSFHQTEGLFVYLECLNYDFAPEFAQMVQKTECSTFRGRNYCFPKRIQAVVDGIKRGTLNYLGTPRANAMR